MRNFKLFSIWKIILWKICFTENSLFKHWSIGRPYASVSLRLTEISTSHGEPTMSRFWFYSLCNKNSTKAEIRSRSNSLELSTILFVTDEYECARSSRRWWWWCARMEQFQVSKKQSETSERTNEQKIYSDWLWSYYNNTHAEKSVYLFFMSVCLCSL